MDGDVSISVPDESSMTFNSDLGNSDPLDVAALADFEDEAALINDLLLSEGRNGDTSVSFLDAAASANTMLLPELDVKLARLLGILEHACQDTSAQVERAIEEVSRSVPRLTFDLQLMRENVVLLRFTLDSIRKRSIEATAHNETSQVMRRLKVLDTIKTRMEAARDVLREAEAWSTLESEVTALVQEQSYAKAAERLAEANKSMVVFQNSPEYEQRRSLMISLQNGLEAGLSASLVTAINARDVNACKNYYAIFGQIQRETEFRNYYFGSRRAHLVNDWQHARLTDCPTATTTETLSIPSRPSSPAPPISFSTYLPNFYARLQNSLNEERNQIPAIFPDPLDTLSSFLQSTIDSLVPSLPQRISDLSNSHGPQLLVELIKIYHSTEEFAIAVDRIFSRMAAALAPATPASGTASPSTPQRGSISSEAGPPTPGGPPSSALKRVRRQSKAMSISRRHSRGGLSPFGGPPHLNGSGSLHGRMSIAESSEPVRAWETSLFEPFLDWQAEYADLETRLLNSEVAQLTSGQDATAFLLTSASISNVSEGDDESSSSSQRKNVAKILLDQSLGVFGLAEEAMGRCMAITHGYGAAAYVEAADMILKNFLHKERDTITRAVDLRTRRRRSTISSAESDGSIEYSQEDWATFQLALRLLDASRTIWDRIGALERKVLARLVDVASLIKEARTDPLSQVVPGTSKGALVLLWQSTLNSAALNSLVDSIDQYQQSPQAGPSPPVLFTKARSASIDLTRASQLFLHNTMLAPLLQALQKYPTMTVWSQSSENRQDNRGAAFDLHIPTFSLSPSETITHVGEGLFNLPGLFEVYAEDDALGFSLDTLPGLDAHTVKHLRKEHGQSAGVGIGNAPLPSPQQTMNRHGHRMSIVGNEFLPSKLAEPQTVNHTARISPSLSHHSSYSMSSPAASTPGQEQQTEALSAELVISTWLSSLTRSVLNHLVKETLPSIRYISKHGEAQLVSDLAYISNVAKALDVELEELESWKAALEGGDNSSSKTADDEAEQSAAPISPEIVETLRRMRLRPLPARP